MADQYTNIPPEIRALKAFLVWRAVPRANGKTGKEPHYVSGGKRCGTNGSPADLAKLATFEEAIAALKAHPNKFMGIGVAMLPQFSLVALDVDNCIENGTIPPDVLELVDTTYAETSPSGKGIRAFFAGSAKDGKNTKDGYELFCSKNFVTITGDQIDNTFKQCEETELLAIDPPLLATLESLARPPSTASTKPKPAALQAPQAPANTLTLADDAPRDDTIVDLKSALAALPDQYADEYDQWIKIILALASLKNSKYADQALELAHNFSKRSGKYDSDVLNEKWESANSTQITYKSIFHSAQKHGWKNPRRQQRKGKAGRITSFTDTDNARRIVKYFGDDIRFVPDTGTWLTWRDGRWASDPTHATIYNLISDKLPDLILKEALDVDQAKREDYLKGSMRLKYKRVVDDVHIMTAIQPEIRLQSSALDADPFLIGLNGGRHVIDLKTGQTRPATQSDYITKSLAPDTLGDPTKAVKWRKFLSDVLNSTVIDWFHRFCGYLLTGSTTEHIILFCYGTGANGKSVLADVLKYTMGDYARTIATQTLTDIKRQAAGHSTDLVRLRGARLTIASETEEGVPLAESFVKSITGSDVICARELHKAPIEFTPEFKLMLLGNHKPRIRNNDEGMWRRLRLLPFLRQFTGPDCNPNLAAELKEEAPHILAWLVGSHCKTK